MNNKLIFSSVFLKMVWLKVNKIYWIIKLTMNSQILKANNSKKKPYKTASNKHFKSKFYFYFDQQGNDVFRCYFNFISDIFSDCTQSFKGNLLNFNWMILRINDRD